MATWTDKNEAQLKDALRNIKNHLAYLARRGMDDSDAYSRGLDTALDIQAELRSRNRPEFPVYYDPQGNEHAEF